MSRRSGAGHGAPASAGVRGSRGTRESARVSAANEPPERSGAWGPRERRRKGVRGTKSPGQLRRRAVETESVETVVERVDEGAGLDTRQQERRGRADDLRPPLRAVEPLQQLDLFLNRQRANVVQHNRADLIHRREHELVAW